MSIIPKAVRDAVLLRAGGSCERCGAWSKLELHHRQFRSRGGAHTVENIVALCGWGNHTGCHGWAHTEGVRATAEGYAIRSGLDPAFVPVRVSDDIWQRLTTDGDTVWCPPGDAIEYMHLIGAVK